MALKHSAHQHVVYFTELIGSSILKTVVLFSLRLLVDFRLQSGVNIFQKDKQPSPSALCKACYVMSVDLRPHGELGQLSYLRMAEDVHVREKLLVCVSARMGRRACHKGTFILESHLSVSPYTQVSRWKWNLSFMFMI